jgi:hypothetical protein
MWGSWHDGTTVTVVGIGTDAKTVIRIDRNGKVKVVAKFRRRVPILRPSQGGMTWSASADQRARAYTPCPANHERQRADNPTGTEYRPSRS